MNRPRLLCGIKITWSALCGLAAVLLVLLWVRSYWVTDFLNCSSPTASEAISYSVGTKHGILKLGRMTFPLGPNVFVSFTGWTHVAVKTDDEGVRSFAWDHDSEEFAFQFPIFLPAIVVVATAWIPWITWRKRFGLRTLLIATTLVAIVLGVVVWSIR
jgi:hypothetical protein